MGKIKITSDGTIAGTTFEDATTGAPLTGIRGLQLARDKTDPSKIVAVITMRPESVTLDNIEAAIEIS